jgi:endonuclease YncB( thermonuclease family)
MNDELLLPQENDWRYWYTCSLIRVIDGDSVELSVDLGFNVRIDITARLLGINAPEMRISNGCCWIAFG